MPINAIKRKYTSWQYHMGSLLCVEDILEGNEQSSAVDDVVAREDIFDGYFSSTGASSLTQSPTTHITELATNGFTTLLQHLDLIATAFPNLETFKPEPLKIPFKPSFTHNLNAVSAFKLLRWLILHGNGYDCRDEMHNILPSDQDMKYRSSEILQDVMITCDTDECLLLGWHWEKGWLEK
ncbi:hypothetical protein M422DRAFT_268931 [Sphaerobolus stellatus SS14]|uniref:Uncharacterized protein n=1 Tax=Sphaerobolus stellatus (strain SS14) TaxID=990650 RepID=A0A0C9TJ05_SPHS4|nr:hypothetical protein M422DRAFT_268931 [Sphaerobolus stellatus SS14]